MVYEKLTPKLHAGFSARLCTKIAQVHAQNVRGGVSIHAPVKGRLVARSPIVILVSIHAPVKGRHYVAVCFPHMRGCFNPRPREGATYFEKDAPRAVQVSIHAPREGATHQHTRCRPNKKFQSTPP